MLRNILFLLILGGSCLGLAGIMNTEGAYADMLNVSFAIGDTSFTPIQLLFGFIVTCFVIFLGKLVTGLFDKFLLARGGIHPASRDSLSTILGYLVSVIAIAIGLSVAGVSLTNFAIIAGALSVGVGFGLQNIVNNFISGIILLIEQPVRTGDFVRAGGVEGYVRRIRIRYTEVETLERQSVIVPNSQLISESVTNFNLRDNFARISVTVGVSYGSDTRKVEALMLEAAEEHPNVLPEGNSVPAMRVVFSDFGDSALVFILHCYVAEAAHRFRIASDIRYAIDDAFRQNGIQIPFPQRDLHLVSDSRVVAKD
jgi:small-conductance mechanosensitive channel